MRVSKRAQAVHVAQTDLAVTLDRFQREHGLTDVEMLQGVSSWQASCLKYMLRRERNPDAPDLPADEAREGSSGEHA